MNEITRVQRAHELRQRRTGEIALALLPRPVRGLYRLLRLMGGRDA